MMKKLFDYRLLMLLMAFLLPSVVHAQNAYIRVWNNTVNTQYSMGGHSASGTVHSWKETWPGSKFTNYINSTTKKLSLQPYIDWGSGYYYHSTPKALTNGETISLSSISTGEPYIDFGAIGDNYQDYDFTFELTNFDTGNTGSVNLKVSWALRTGYEISVDGTTWTTITLGTTIDASLTPFYLRKVTDSSTYSYYTATDGTLTPGTAKTTTFTSDASAKTLFNPTHSSLYGFTLNFTDASITLTDKSIGNTYYLVSPELTGGQMLPEFRLTPSRARGGGALSTALYTLNLKQDRLATLLAKYNTANGTSLTDIHYYIVQGDGSTVSKLYYSWSADYQIAKAGQSDTKYKTANNNVRYGTYGTKNDGVLKFLLPSGDGVSYTWLFDASTKGNAGWIELDVNQNPLKENTEKSYYVVGNFADADATVNIHPYETSGRAKMTRMVYYHATPGVGVVDATTAYDNATMDSVVYRVTIPRPSAGWGELYLAVADSGQVAGSASTDWGARWDNVIRPQVQDYGSDGGSGMDGTALEGGLFKGDAATNKSQALNPMVSGKYADATSYTFQMNLTTSTYRIMFNEEDMYIMGPAVKSTEVAADKTGWESDDADNGKKLTWVDAEQCFKYLGASGVEQPIVLRTGKTFRFCYGKVFTNVWFGEDGVYPADLSNTANAYTALEGRYDTQYVNYLNTYKSAPNTANNTYDVTKVDPAMHCTFNLPQKSGGAGYIIRLYLKKIGDDVKYFYTINRKITFTNLTLADADKIEGNDYYRSFSEWHACKKPEGVKAYIVSGYDASAKTATLRELALDYIPARTGVILATDNGSAVDFETYADDPEITLDAATTNYLKAQMADAEIAYSADSKYNYIFYFYALPNLSGVNTLGFYHPATGFMSGRNFSYLQIPENVTGGSTGAAKAATSFRFIFEDSVTNGIETIADREAGNNNDAYYTLEGIKTDRPAAKGIYIRNGKKIIIK